MNDTNEYTTAAPWPKAIWIDITPQATYVKLKAGLSSCGSIHGRKSVSCFIYFDLEKYDAPCAQMGFFDPQATYVKLKAGLSSCGSIHGRKSVSCFIYFDLEKYDAPCAQMGFFDPQATYVKLKAGLSSCGSMYKFDKQNRWAYKKTRQWGSRKTG